MCFVGWCSAFVCLFVCLFVCVFWLSESCVRCVLFVLCLRVGVCLFACLCLLYVLFMHCDRLVCLLCASCVPLVCLLCASCVPLVCLLCASCVLHVQWAHRFIFQGIFLHMWRHYEALKWQQSMPKDLRLRRLLVRPTRPNFGRDSWPKCVSARLDHTPLLRASGRLRIPWNE